MSTLSKIFGVIRRFSEKLFITADQGLEYQKNLTNVEIAVIVLLAPTNRFHDLKPLAPRILEALREARPGSVIHVGD